MTKGIIKLIIKLDTVFNDDLYAKDKYKMPRLQAPHYDFHQKQKNWKKGLTRVIDWLFYTVLVSGIPLLLYFFLSCLFGSNEMQGISELSAFFFGVTLPAVIENKKSVNSQYTQISEWVRTILILLVFVYGMLYTIIYLLSYVDSVLNAYQLSVLRIGTKLLGGGCFIFVLCLQWFGGYNDD